MKKFKPNLYLKLTIVVFAFGILLNLAIIAVFRFNTDIQPRKDFPEMIRRMERGLIAEIGSPPDTLLARKMCEELDWNLRFQSKEMNWSTKPDVPTFEELSSNPRFKEKSAFRDHFIIKYNGKPLSVFFTPDGVFIVQPLNPRDLFYPERAIMAVIILLVILIAVLFFVLRKLFKPIKQLSAAVKQIGEGNYGVTIPVERNDELGELTSSINEMSTKIKSQIQAKEQLLLDVSHELRTPLTRMKLELEVDSPKEKIKEEINEMESMVANLLNSYRTGMYDRLTLEKCDINALLMEMVSDVAFNSRVKLVNKAGLIFISLDRDKIITAIRNIIDNALKYSTEGVEVVIEDAAANVLISVSDRGPGIPEDSLKYIFEPFYRVDPSRSKKTGGFGLGLSISKRIIDAHEGKISIESKSGEGTKVKIYLKKN
jgi:signal transduction histidine kinase